MPSVSSIVQKKATEWTTFSFSFSITSTFIFPLILLPEREAVASTLRVNLSKFDLFPEIMYKYLKL